MLIMKSFCQSCNLALSPIAEDVYICGHERTVCHHCAEKQKGVCTGCGGKLQLRPSRHMEMETACRKCKTTLAPDGPAEFCSYENTYCMACAKAANHVCPACHGKLQVRAVPHPLHS
jgi:hypothetical protein